MGSKCAEKYGSFCFIKEMLRIFLKCLYGSGRARHQILSMCRSSRKESVVENRRKQASEIYVGKIFTS